MENKDIIEIARELGRQLQREDAYIKFNMARQAADEDKELQKLIAEFSAIRAEIAELTTKPDDERDPDTSRKLGEDMRSVYAKIMSNQHMINYNEAKDNFDIIMNRISAIIQKSSEGEDPDTADYTPSCSGSCATCGGCH